MWRTTPVSAPSTPEQLLLTAIAYRSCIAHPQPFRLDAAILSRAAIYSVEYSLDAAILAATGLEQRLIMTQPGGAVDNSLRADLLASLVDGRPAPC